MYVCKFEPINGERRSVLIKLDCFVARCIYFFPVAVKATICYLIFFFVSNFKAMIEKEITNFVAKWSFLSVSSCIIYGGRKKTIFFIYFRFIPNICRSGLVSWSVFSDIWAVSKTIIVCLCRLLCSSPQFKYQCLISLIERAVMASKPLDCFW